MIGVHPVSKIAPLDYRYALDALMARLAQPANLLVHCNLPELEDELRQRALLASLTNIRRSTDKAQAGLWIEPLTGSWQTDLNEFSTQLPKNAPLIIIASRPLARLLPERRQWTAVAPLAMQTGGLNKLRRAVVKAGFKIETQHGMHTVAAIGLNSFGQQLNRLNRPELADRCHFAARLHYCKGGVVSPFSNLQATFSTVALLVARKERA